MNKMPPLAQRFFSALAGAFREAPMVEWAVFVLAVLLPILYIPGSAELSSPFKHLVLVTCVAVGLFGWSAHVYRQRAWHLRSSWALWLPFAVLFGVMISAALSSSGYGAWIGAGSLGFTAVVPTLALVGLYALVVHVGDHRKTLRTLSFGMLLGGALTGVFSLLSLFRVIPEALAPQASSPLATPEALTIYLSVLSVFALGIWIVDDHDSTDVWLPTALWRRVHWPVWIVLWASTLVWLAVTDTLFSQIILIAGSGALVALGLFQPSRFVKPMRMLALMAVFGLGLLLLILPSPFTGRVSTEVGLNLRASSQIALSTLKTEGWLFGSGPGSYLFDYSLHRPVEIVRTSFWSLPFDHSFFFLLDLAATWGLVPTTLYAAFILWMLWRLVHALLVRRVREQWQTLAVLGSVWGMLALAQVIYAPDVVLMAVFWMLTGLTAAHVVNRRRAISFASNARAALASSGLFVAMGIVMVVSVSAMLQWFSSSAFVSAARRHSDEPYAVDAKLLRAIRLNPWSADVYRMHALAHLRIADDLAIDADAFAQVQKRMQWAIEDANRAVLLEPRDVRNHEARRRVFSVLGNMVAGADRAATDSALKAAQLDPHNPVRWQRVAESYLVMAQNAQSVVQNENERVEVVDGLLAQAEASIETAIAKKPNYAPSYYTRGLVYQRQGRLNEAIAQLSALVNNTPGDAILRFELGVLHLHQGAHDKARIDFETAVALQPTFANAKWYLASAYESEGRTQEALRQLEDLLILDPDNESVRDRMDLMRGGDDLLPSEVPPLEEPSDILE